MAQAYRTIWLEPEEQHETQTPRLRARRRQPVVKTAAVALQGPRAALGVVVLMAVIVGLVVAYISSYARIASLAFQRQALRTEMHALQQDCSQLRLEVAHLENTPRITQMAAAQQLEFPSADRVHYLTAVRDLPSTVAASPNAARSSWTSHTGRQVVATLDHAIRSLSRAPGAPAVAQE